MAHRTMSSVGCGYSNSLAYVAINTATRTDRICNVSSVHTEVDKLEEPQTASQL